MKKTYIVIVVFVVFILSIIMAHASSDFIMPVEDFDSMVYPLAEHNTVAVMGCVKNGTAKVGDTVKLVGVGTKKRIKRIETLGEYHEKAITGKCYGIILGDTDYNTIQNLKSLEK